MPETSGILTSALALSGVVLGYGIKAVSDWVQHKWDVERRNQEKQEKQWEQRSGFQRATLLELQEILADFMRSMGAIHHHDAMATKSGFGWRKTQISEEMDRENFRIMKRCNVLRVRVQDEQVRIMVKQMKDAAGSMVVSMTQEQGDMALAEMGVIWEKLNERIGEILRKIDAEHLQTRPLE